MNLTIQQIVNRRSTQAYSKSLATYKEIISPQTKIRLNGNTRQRLKPNSQRVVRFVVNGIAFNMIYCSQGFYKDPTHILLGGGQETKVEQPFLIGETQVTQELFNAVMGFNPSSFQGDGYPNPKSNQRPVETVTRYDALIFCNKLSVKLGLIPYYNVTQQKKHYDRLWKEERPTIVDANESINRKSKGFRLPSVGEWLYAVKSGDNESYGLFDKSTIADHFLWLENNSHKQTQPVKSKLPNRWGIYDMGGNVKEICSDLSQRPGIGPGSSMLLGFHAGESMMDLNRFHTVISPLRKGIGILGANGEVGFRIALSTKQNASLFRKNPKGKKHKKTAVIIKGNPYFMQGEYKEKYDAFYDHVKSILLNVGYDRVMFDDGEEGTLPPRANLWVAHSRGKGRLKFAPFGTQTLILDDYEDISKEYNMELKAIKEKLGVTNMNEIPLSLRPIPRENHYTVNSKMQIALEKTI